MAEIISDTTLNTNSHENEIVENSYKNNALSHSSSGSQVINEVVSTIVEQVHSALNRVNNLQDFNDTKCTNKNTKSPCKNIYLFNQNDLLKSPLFKSPVFKKYKSTQSVDMAQNKRKRTISGNSDYDMFKEHELDTENFNSFEGIELLHDLDSVIKFEDSNIFLSTIMDMSQEDDLLDVNKDPVTDPLSISDCEKKDTDTLANSYSMSSKRHRTEVKLESQMKRRRSKRLKKEKCKLNKEEKHLLEELNKFKKKEEISLSDIKKLLNLRIKLTHKVPQQHKIELSGSHAPTKKEKILFLKHGPIRKGLYTPKEDNIIRLNWYTFCKLHNWDTKKAKPFLYWRHNGKYYINNLEERQKFVQFLANGLPWRTLYSVYSRFKILFRKKVTHARYTSAEDEKILMYIKNTHLDKRYSKYSELAKLLGRTGQSILKRYKYLKNQNKAKSRKEPLVGVKWTLLLIKKFIKTLLSVTISKDIIELKDATFPKPVWQKMEEKLNIRENVLRAFWHNQLHLQLFSISPIYLNDIKIQLIEYMYAKGISNTREIIWPNVAKYFDGATAVFLCKIFFYLVQECDIDDSDNFANIVEHLYHTKISEIQKAPTDKFLPKIIYKNGKIFLLNTENKTLTGGNDHQETDYSTDSTDD